MTKQVANTSKVPRADDAEKALLGSIFFDERILDEVADYVSVPEAFFSLSHQAIFAAMLDCRRRGTPIDAITVTDAMKSAGREVGSGDLDQIAALAGSFGSSTAALHHARIVQRTAQRRMLLEALSASMDDAIVPTDDIDEMLAGVERRIDAVRSGSPSTFVGPEVGLTEAITRMSAEMETDRSTFGVATGFRELDSKLGGGLQPSNLVIIAGRPGMGKTAFALTIAISVAQTNKVEMSGAERAQNVAFFSLEMPKVELAMRTLSNLSGVEFWRFREPRKHLTHSDHWQKVLKGADKVAKLSLFIDDGATQNVQGIRAKARRLARSLPGGLSLIVVDYLQLVDGGERRPDARHLEVAEITKGLRQLAKELSVPVLALAQLNRQSESRKTNLPLLSDLRESGSIEQDADVVVFVHRPEYYNKDDKELEGLAQIIVAKQRNGPTGTVEVRYDAPRMYFEDKPQKDERAPGAGTHASRTGSEW